MECKHCDYPYATKAGCSKCGSDNPRPMSLASRLGWLFIILFFLYALISVVFDEVSSTNESTQSPDAVVYRDDIFDESTTASDFELLFGMHEIAVEQTSLRGKIEFERMSAETSNDPTARVNGQVVSGNGEYLRLDGIMGLFNDDCMVFGGTIEINTIGCCGAVSANGTYVFLRGEKLSFWRIYEDEERTDSPMLCAQCDYDIKIYE